MCHEPNASGASQTYGPAQQGPGEGDILRKIFLFAARRSTRRAQREDIGTPLEGRGARSKLRSSVWEQPTRSNPRS